MDAKARHSPNEDDPLLRPKNTRLPDFPNIPNKNFTGCFKVSDNHHGNIALTTLRPTGPPSTLSLGAVCHSKNWSPGIYLCGNAFGVPQFSSNRSTKRLKCLTYSHTQSHNRPQWPHVGMQVFLPPKPTLSNWFVMTGNKKVTCWKKCNHSFYLLLLLFCVAFFLLLLLVKLLRSNCILIYIRSLVVVRQEPT